MKNSTVSRFILQGREAFKPVSPVVEFILKGRA